MIWGIEKPGAHRLVLQTGVFRLCIWLYSQIINTCPEKQRASPHHSVKEDRGRTARACSAQTPEATIFGRGPLHRYICRSNPLRTQNYGYVLCQMSLVLHSELLL